MSINLRKGESRAIDRAITGPARLGGYHLFISSEEVELKKDNSLKKRQEAQKAECLATGKTYVAEPLLNALHGIRTSMWGELTKEEKSEWAEAAKTASDIYHLSKNR